jgi:hypothetical protein
MLGANVFAMKFVIAVAAFAALVYARPDADLIPEVTSAPVVAPNTASALGVMMAMTSDNMPVFGVPRAVMVPVPPDMALLDPNLLDTQYGAIESPVFDTLLAVPDPDCPVTLVGERQPLALVELHLTAPCLPTTRLVVRHGPLEFAVRTNSTGAVQFTVPALAREAGFTVLRDNMELARTDVFVPDVWRFDRVALNWRGPEVLNLHALGDASQIGDEGHIWRAAPGSLADVAEGRAGYLFEYRDREGDMPVHAEVFTFPVGQGVLDGDITMRISGLLHPRNCGREVGFWAIKAVDGQGPNVTPLSVRMPGCGQLGHVVMLDKDLPTLIAEAG